MNWVDSIFFIYMFFGLYMTSLFIFLYLPNRRKMFGYPKGKLRPISIVMPCYNESEHIGEAIESLLNLNYPKNMIEIIIVDDMSKDNSVDIIRKYVKKYNNIKLIINKRNSGGAAEPTNMGVLNAKYEYVAVVDSDSSPEKDALIKMIGFLEEPGVEVVTCSILSKEPRTFIQKMQEVEYIVIAFTRRLLDFVDSVYVTPGPLALYRKKTLIEIGLFDKNNMTQDIEMTWKILSNNYKTRMCLDAKVYSATPDNWKDWTKQRIRWDIGGIQTLIKYRYLFLRKGMLGRFIMPIFGLSLFLGLFGLLLFIYLFLRKFFVSYLSTKYSVYAGISVLRLQELSFAPSVINFFAISLFILGIWFTIFGLNIIREDKKHNVFNLLFYLIIYLAAYPIVLVAALYKMVKRNYSW